MKIDILCNDGSPLGVTSKSIWGLDGRVGVGGAELALLTMCEAWLDAGHNVTLYNNPSEYGVSKFDQKNIYEFSPDSDRDVLIIFRSPNSLSDKAKGMKVWWSCDQFTVGNFSQFSKTVDKIVVISPFHQEYFETMYEIKNSIVIDLPVRLNDYMDNVEKVHGRCVYTSIPSRGAMQLNAAWPLITREFEEASLVLTSDWRLWDPDIDQSCVFEYRSAYSTQRNASYIGAVKRDLLIKNQLAAELLLYPCTYDELFCIAVAEAQVAGAIPITSKVGAVATTNEFGIQVAGSPYEPKFIEEFVERTLHLLRNRDELSAMQADVSRKARERFSPQRIVKEWDEKVFNNG